MSTTNIVDAVCRDFIQPALRQRDFTKSARTWRRKREAIVHLINIQIGKIGSCRRGDFTMNLGVFEPRIYSAVWNQRMPQKPKIDDACLQVRIGSLGLGGSLLEKDMFLDQWWDFDENTDIAELGQDLARILITRGVPFLDQFTSLQSIATFLLGHQGYSVQVPLEQLYTGAACAVLGDFDTAQRYFVMAAQWNRGWEERVLKTAKRVGVPVTLC